MGPIIALLLALTLGSITLDEIVAKDTKNELITHKENEQPYLSLNIDNGSKLQFSDGTTYIISPDDRIYTIYWITPFPVKFSQSGDEDFPTKITNVNTGTSVQGKLISGKALLQAEIAKEQKRREEAAKQKQLHPAPPPPSPPPPPIQSPPPPTTQQPRSSQSESQKKTPEHKSEKPKELKSPESKSQELNSPNSKSQGLNPPEEKIKKPAQQETNSQ